MLAALSALGNLTKVQTKTSIVLAPRVGGHGRAIRKGISTNMHPRTENAFYINLRTGNAFDWGYATRFKWRTAN